MARHRPNERKRRTREHVICDQSINHVERQIIDAGHVVMRNTVDYGIDLVITTFDAEGFLEAGGILLQVKASESLQRTASGFYHDLDIRNYNVWRIEVSLVCLILYEASTRKAYYLELTELFRDPQWRGPRRGASTVRITVPSRNGFNRNAVARLQQLKNRKLGII